jgi:hypothetical protein|tara:strand:- start:2044 stop:2379 length:336 start_codon:yes stop_codon:yes gene_type:complete
MGLIVFILLNYGITNIIVYGSIFEGFRDFWVRVSPKFFGVLFNCMVCLPFWVGLFLSLTFQLMGYGNMSPTASQGIDNIYLSLFLDGCLSSGVTWLVHSFQEMTERAFNED